MAKYGQGSVFLLVDGYNISGDTFEMEKIKEAAVEQTDGFGDTWVERTATGIKSGGITHRCFYDDAALATNAALVAGVGVSRVLLAGLEGNVQGRKCVGFEGAMQTKFVRNPVRGELHKCSAEYLNNGDIDEPKIIQVLAAQGSTGTGSSGSLDNAAGSSNGGVAYLEVTGLTLGGYTSVTVVLQQSSDNGGADPFSALVTFTNVVGSTPGSTWAQRIEVAPATTVERYLRASITFNGAGSGQSITYTVAFERR